MIVEVSVCFLSVCNGKYFVLVENGKFPTYEYDGSCTSYSLSNEILRDYFDIGPYWNDVRQIGFYEDNERLTLLYFCLFTEKFACRSNMAEWVDVDSGDEEIKSIAKYIIGGSWNV